MHRGGVFLPPARVTVRINEKEKRKETSSQARTTARKSLLFYPFLSKEPKSAIKKVRRFD